MKWVVQQLLFTHLAFWRYLLWGLEKSKLSIAKSKVIALDVENLLTKSLKGQTLIIWLTDWIESLRLQFSDMAGFHLCNIIWSIFDRRLRGWLKLTDQMSRSNIIRSMFMIPLNMILGHAVLFGVILKSTNM